MRLTRDILGLLLLSSAFTVLNAQATEASILEQLRGLRAQPTDQRPAVTRKIAADIRTLPAGAMKLKLADALSHLVTEGDPGHETLQAVASTLEQSLAESPLPEKDGKPAMPYMDLASLVRYEHVTVERKSPELQKADEILVANDAEIAKANFTLKDLNGKTVTLSDLRGKIVLVNFWATWCPPCRLEMPDLDAIYTQYQSQGLVILSISDEDAAKVAAFISRTKYHPPVLLDPDRSANNSFHVQGIPKSFVFNREGKLVAQSIDMRTRRQFMEMLATAGLHS